MLDRKKTVLDEREMMEMYRIEHRGLWAMYTLLCATVVAQLLFLEMEDPDADISLYINSPGGSVTAGLAILDTMEHIRCDVSTIAVGMAASMGAVLLAAGAKGKRRVLPNAEVMIHQPLGGAEGQASDVLIRARHLERTRTRLTNLLVSYTGKDREQLAADMDRDNFMNAEETVAYGLADEVVKQGTTPSAA